MANPPKEALAHFNANASRYESSTGSCTRELARYLIDISPPLETTSHILDNACGPGIVAQEILYKQYAAGKAPPKISCVDGAATMSDLARAAVTSIIDANKARVPTDAEMFFDAMPGEELRFPDNHFTHSFTNHGIQFFKDGNKGASELYRTLQPGGSAVVTTWKELPYVAPLQAAQKVVTPGAPLFRVPIPEVWWQASHLKETLENGGFANVDVHEKIVHYAFESKSQLCDALVVLLGYIATDLTEQQKADIKEHLMDEVEKIMVKTERVMTGDMEGRTEELVALEMVSFVGVAKK
jgi:ubiquinone/menaquinone biosynthesis C-methylase UbiE